MEIEEVIDQKKNGSASTWGKLRGDEPDVRLADPRHC